MRISEELLEQIVSDLSINEPFIKGRNHPVKNCWHFYTDGGAIDRMFDDEIDFINGMNRIYTTCIKFDIIILAFCLMDTHFHFIVYGKFEQCNRFMHEYLRLTSMNISLRHSEKKKLLNLPLSHQNINNDFYLKVAITYVLKNAPVGGLNFNAWDYPWCSGSLYFRKNGYWTTPDWKNITENQKQYSLSYREKRNILKTHHCITKDILFIGNLVFPGEYVAYEIVEKIYKSNKSFNWYLCISKEEDIELMEGSISRLSIPIQEMRQNRNALCSELFNAKTIRTLTTGQRIKLAKTLRLKYNSSVKQIAKLCGLIYDEIKEIL